MSPGDELLADFAEAAPEREDIPLVTGDGHATSSRARNSAEKRFKSLIEGGPRRVSKGERDRAAKEQVRRDAERDKYRASVAQDLAMHHQVIGQLVQQVTKLIQRVDALEAAQPKVEVFQSIPAAPAIVL